MAIDPDALRETMRQWATGVTVVSAAHSGRRHGMTVSSFTSLSLNPPLVLVSLEQGAKTHHLVLQAGHFGVTILSESQQELSDRFAGRQTELSDRFAGLETFTLLSGAPLLRLGLAWLDCRVAETYQAGNHTVFIGETLACMAAPGEPPLIYHDRGYRRLRL